MKVISPYTVIIFVTVATAALPLSASTKVHFDSAQVRINLIARTPQQMAAFYEARGFQKAMLDKIQQYCFITVYIRNKSKHILWHDLNNWHFESDHKIIQRTDRNMLGRIWKNMNIPLAHQSTFRWTLLPEQLDFRPDEAEGGNIVLPWPDKPVTIQASFKVQRGKVERVITTNFTDITCKK